MTAWRGAGELAVEIDRGIVLAGFGEHEGVDALRAGKLLEIGAGAFDGSDVVFLGEGVFFLEFGGVKIELLLGEREPFGVRAAIAGPPFHQHRRKKELVALIVVRGSDEVGLEGVIRGRVFGAGGGGEAAQIFQDGGLGGLEQELAEAIEVDTAHFGVEGIAGSRGPSDSSTARLRGGT